MQGGVAISTWASLLGRSASCWRLINCEYLSLISSSDLSCSSVFERLRRSALSISSWQWSPAEIWKAQKIRLCFDDVCLLMMCLLVMIKEEQSINQDLSMWVQQAWCFGDALPLHLLWFWPWGPSPASLPSSAWSAEETRYQTLSIQLHSSYKGDGRRLATWCGD